MKKPKEATLGPSQEGEETPPAATKAPAPAGTSRPRRTSKPKGKQALPVRRPAAGPSRARKASSLSALTDGVIAALTAAGGADYLLAIARDDPKTFCALLTRILPAKAEGKGDGGVALRWAGEADGE